MHPRAVQRRLGGPPGATVIMSGRPRRPDKGLVHSPPGRCAVIRWSGNTVQMDLGLSFPLSSFLPGNPALLTAEPYDRPAVFAVVLQFSRLARPAAHRSTSHRCRGRPALCGPPRQRSPSCWGRRTMRQGLSELSPSLAGMAPAAAASKTGTRCATALCGV